MKLEPMYFTKNVKEVFMKERVKRTVTFQIPIDLYRWMKVYCAEHDLTITEFLTSLIETVKKRTENYSQNHT